MESLTPVEPWVPSDLSVSYRLDRPRNARVLVVGVDGVYPPGSQGSEHARYISRMLIQGFMEFDPVSVVLDLSGMAYTWGDTLLSVFSDFAQWTSELDPPALRVVLSDRCDRAFFSLTRCSTKCPSSGSSRPRAPWRAEDSSLTPRRNRSGRSAATFIAAILSS